MYIFSIHEYQNHNRLDDQGYIKKIIRHTWYGEKKSGFLKTGKKNQGKKKKKKNGEKTVGN
jgi:hypothetical protein